MIAFNVSDHVYIENNRQNNPYFICAIQDFSVVSILISVTFFPTFLLLKLILFRVHVFSS